MKEKLLLLILLIFAKFHCQNFALSNEKFEDTYWTGYQSTYLATNNSKVPFFLPTVSDGRLMTIVSWLLSDDHWLITVVVWFISNFVRFGKQKKNSRTKPKNCRHFIVSIPILIIPWIPILSWILASYDPGLLLWILIRFLNWIYWLVQQFSDLLQVCIFLENWSARVPWIW